jgi:hypothetical protein
MTTTKRPAIYTLIDSVVSFDVPVEQLPPSLIRSIEHEFNNATARGHDFGAAIQLAIVAQDVEYVSGGEAVTCVAQSELHAGSGVTVEDTHAIKWVHGARHDGYTRHYARQGDEVIVMTKSRLRIGGVE